MNKDNYEYFEKHQKELLDKYYDKYILIANGAFVRSFDDENEAIKYAVDNYVSGDYIVHHCIPEEDQEMKFYSRVHFSTYA